LAIRRGLFRWVGGFDAAYVNGLEDTALCLAVRDTGYRIRYVPDARVRHWGRRSAGRGKHDWWNVLRFLDEWGQVAPRDAQRVYAADAAEQGPVVVRVEAEVRGPILLVKAHLVASPGVCQADASPLGEDGMAMGEYPLITALEHADGIVAVGILPTPPDGVPAGLLRIRVRDQLGRERACECPLTEITLPGRREHAALPAS
jgi:hypothetical protein